MDGVTQGARPAVPTPSAMLVMVPLSYFSFCILVLFLLISAELGSSPQPTLTLTPVANLEGSQGHPQV